MSIKCIIIEDEPLAMERVSGFVAQLPSLQLLATFDNALEALSFLKANAVDLIFLDINLGEFSGIQLLESVTINSQVILTTAYDEYALKGYELKVADYLLKPYTFERFVQAVDRVEQNLSPKMVANDKPYLFVKTEHRLEKVDLAGVLFIEGMRDYRRIHLRHKKIMTLQTFSSLEEAIPEHQICRVHKSYMVALDKIESIERDRIKIGKELIPISGTYRKRFYELIDQQQ